MGDRISRCKPHKLLCGGDVSEETTTAHEGGGIGNVSIDTRGVSGWREVVGGGEEVPC